MKRCIIITSYIEGNLADIVEICENDYVICADGGYDHAKKFNIIPDLLVGDFDSLKSPIDPEIEIITFPSEKDDTDTGLCISTALQKGFRQLVIIGGMGGRFDHAMANIQIMLKAAEQSASVVMTDKHNFATILINSQLKIPKKNGHHLSIFSLSEESQGVTVTGVKYPLHNHTLTYNFPLGVSNEFLQPEACVSVKKGKLLIVLSTE